MPYTHEVPPITAEADNDEAAGTLAMSLPQTCSKMGTLSSPEDELSSDRTPLGENAGAKPANKVARRRRHGLRRCHYHNCVCWPPRAFQKPGVGTPVSMITLLKKDHFEPIKAQMLQEEHGKMALKDIGKLTDIPKFKTTMSMLKHIREFETFLSNKYGVDGFPLDYVLWPKLVNTP